MTEALALVIAYLLGSIPSGYLAGRARGIDIRTVGSKNMGATNVFRTLGKGAGIGVMAADILKGVAAVVIARAITDDPWPLIAAGLAIIGHVFPVWLKFKGGKGVATGAGVILGLTPIPFAILFVVWIAIVAATRIVSVASITCAAAYPVLVWIFGGGMAEIIFAIVVSAGVIFLHRKNIARLARGEELRIDLPGRRSPESAGEGG